MKQEIDVTKKYRTRSGEEVTHLTYEDGTPQYPINGYVGHNRRWWTREGVWRKGSETGYDLIPVADDAELRLAAVQKDMQITMLIADRDYWKGKCAYLGASASFSEKVSFGSQAKNTEPLKNETLVADDAEPKVEMPEPPAGMKWEYRGVGAKFSGAFACCSSGCKRALRGWGHTQGYEDNHYWEAVPAEIHGSLKRGDEVVVKSNGRRYEFLEYESAFTAKIMDAYGDTYSYNLDQFVPVLRTYEDETNPIRLRQQRDALHAAIEGFMGDVEYHQDLLDQCARAIGRPAYTCDDGTTQDEPLRAKVPGLVRELVAAGKNEWIGSLIQKSLIAPLVEAAKGVLSMSGMTHPDGGYTLGETGHFQCLKMALEIAEQPPFTPETPAAHPPPESKWPGTVSVKDMMQNVAGELKSEKIDHTEGGKYRMLEEGEVICEWDAYLERGQWVEVQYSIGKPLVLAPGQYWRRPVTREPDYAQQAKNLLHAIHGYPQQATLTAIDTFVDLIIKAAKNESMA